MLNSVLTPVWDLWAQWSPLNDISPKRTGTDILSVLVDTFGYQKSKNIKVLIFFQVEIFRAFTKMIQLFYKIGPTLMSNTLKLYK